MTHTHNTHNTHTPHTYRVGARCAVVPIKRPAKFLIRIGPTPAKCLAVDLWVVGGQLPKTLQNKEPPQVSLGNEQELGDARVLMTRAILQHASDQVPQTSSSVRRADSTTTLLRAPFNKQHTNEHMTDKTRAEPQHTRHLAIIYPRARSAAWSVGKPFPAHTKESGKVRTQRSAIFLLFFF